MSRISSIIAFVSCLSSAAQAGDPWLTLPGGKGPGQGKSIVLISGDEEYRSEEALPQLGKILAKHHGFDCTVLFAIDPKDGTINPQVNNNIPGLEKLKTADLAIVFTRFRNLPAEQMEHFASYLKAGKPLIGLRTATHGFSLKKDSPFYAEWHWQAADGGFGRKVLGETWVNHHGRHGKEGTRGIFAKGQENHPIVRGIENGSIFGPSDVYTVKLPLPGDSQPIVLGQVTVSLDPKSEPLPGPKNDPMMPIAWTKSYSWGGPKGKVFTSTMACSQDFSNEPLRRLMVNACYWCLGMESAIPAKANVDLIGDYKPTAFKNPGHKTGLKPEDLK
jgi:type 1 glutamine amidotransferase